jgi:hypothetical protein
VSVRGVSMVHDVLQTRVHSINVMPIPK